MDMNDLRAMQEMEAEYVETLHELQVVHRRLSELGREFSRFGRALGEEPGALEDLLRRLPLERTRYLLRQSRELRERKEELEGWLGIVEACVV